MYSMGYSGYSRGRRKRFRRYKGAGVSRPLIRKGKRDEKEKDKNEDMDESIPLLVCFRFTFYIGKYNGGV